MQYRTAQFFHLNSWIFCKTPWQTKCRVVIYEYGTSRPRLDAAEKIAKALNVSTDELLGNADMLVAQANEKYGARGAKQAKQLTDEVTGLFAGGDMAEEDMDLMMKAIQDAYWIAKQNNKKFTPKKHRSE